MWLTLGCSVVVALITLSGCGNRRNLAIGLQEKLTQKPGAHFRSTTAAIDASSFETVDIVGGSMAYGWKDPHNNSYLRRAFTIRSYKTHVKYKYVNHAIPGFTAKWLNRKYPGRFNYWLSHDKPQVLVLSWGLENDMSSQHRDSLRAFSQELRGEITAGLQHQAVVLLISPPVTKLLATKDRHKVAHYIDAEFRVAQSFRNSNVISINLYQQMKTYMKEHHQTYQHYYGNAWHPNQAGHELAGNLLVQDLNKKFGTQAIQFRHEKPRLHPSTDKKATHI